MTKGTRPHTRALVAERRAKAIDLRQAGVDLVTVGRQLRYGKWTRTDGSAFTPFSTPEKDDVQVTSDASLAALVSQDVGRGLKDRRAHLEQSADAMRQESTERLERLRAGIWSKALAGSPAHVREARFIEEQLARLWGTNKPVKHELHAPDAERIVEEALSDLLTLLDRSVPERTAGVTRLAPRALGEDS